MTIKVMLSLCLVWAASGCLHAETAMTDTNNRYDRGLKQLKAIDKEAGERVLETLNSISPDLGRYIIEYAFGDVYHRPELALKAKEIAVVAALTAMGNANPQLKVHIHGALNVGCTIAEVQEVILQMSAYSGFPSAINGMLALKDVLAQRKAEGKKDQPGTVLPAAIAKGKTRYEAGADQLRVLNSDQVEILEKTFADISPDMAKFVIEYGFADLYARPALDLRYREIATIAALTAMGNATSQLAFHIKAGLHIGVTRSEIREIMILMSVYAGFPAAINGTLALKEVLEAK